MEEFMLEQIIEVLREFGIEGEIDPNAQLTAGLGLDSMDLIELAITIEEKFKITLQEGDITPFFTVRQVADFILTRCK